MPDASASRIWRRHARVPQGACLALLLLAAGASLFWKPLLLPAVLGGVGLLFFLWFFRDPERSGPKDPSLILSGADGKVLEVKQLERCEWFEGPAWQVSVFMSPFNVHVNRASMPGTVREIRYRPGKYLMAFHEKSSELNEASTLVLSGTGPAEGRTIAQTQIAGFLARRIVGWTSPGDSLDRGQRYGGIKLGSRMDHFLPAATRITVEPGQKVLAGVTVIGEWT